ncbi:hypothetical protein IV102_27705 [bacterium]|nr:hypothetical protein [bacterium]
MKVQSYSPNNAPLRSLKTPGQDTPGQTPTPPQDGVEVGGGRPFLCGAGGALAGAAAGVASGASVLLAANGLGRVLNATMPTVSSIAPGTTGILLQAAGLSLIGATVAIAAGACVGAKVASGAAKGAVKPDITQSGNEQKGVTKYQVSSAELRQNLSSLKSAKSWTEAAGSGFRAGASLGGPAGAAAGKIQGALLGAALGGVAAIPLMGLISHPAVLLPGAVFGAMLGHKIGEPLGYAAGSFTVGALGAAGGALYHGVAGNKDPQ